ncbi:MAG TPA: hypothetical protein HPQ04_12730 [Rhodospirillaceae bacterium]|nr:hypothetical protein [Rhodospirillaceae bacterium]
MSTAIRQIHSLAVEFQPGLLLVTAVVVLGWLCGWLLAGTTDPEKETAAAFARVYSLDAQPMICRPAKTPPTR